jgi:glycosyltransferase involved in cell wall biosynthesis
MQPKVVVVMPAYNAARTLRMTYEELPKECIDSIILVDDGSTDDTIAIARRLNLEVFVHTRNFGYGANQKTCYREALKAGADIVAMVHPDYQYDPTLLPQIIQPIIDGKAEIVLGSRLQKGSALAQGMPWWKYFANRFLTGLENFCFGLNHSEYHTGYRAFNRAALESVNFEMNSDSFVFDQEIIAQAVASGLRIDEIAVPVRYFKEASSASFFQSSAYGLRILVLLAKYMAHKVGIHHSRQFQSLGRRYHSATEQEIKAHGGA